MSRSPNWKGIVINTLYRRSKGLCGLCQRKISEHDLFEIDHILEKEKSGQDEIKNLRLVHIACHKERHTPTRTFIAPDIIKQMSIGFDLSRANTKREVDEKAHEKILELVRSAYAEHGTLTAAAPACGLSRYQLIRLLKKYDVSLQKTVTINPPRAGLGA